MRAQEMATRGPIEGLPIGFGDVTTPFHLSALYVVFHLVVRFGKFRLIENP